LFQKRLKIIQRKYSETTDSDLHQKVVRCLETMWHAAWSGTLFYTRTRLSCHHLSAWWPASVEKLGPCKKQLVFNCL